MRQVSFWLSQCRTWRQRERIALASERGYWIGSGPNPYRWTPSMCRAAARDAIRWARRWRVWLGT